MFDVGFAELLLLSLVGLLVLGPERLPKVARTLGGLARRARSSWFSLKRSIEAEMRAQELGEPLKQFKNEIHSTVEDLKKGVDPIPKAPTATPASPPAAASSGPDAASPDSAGPTAAEQPAPEAAAPEPKKSDE